MLNRSQLSIGGGNMALKSMHVGPHKKLWLLGFSLFLIFIGAVIASKFDYWYAILGGATLAVVGCYLNHLSTKWLKED